MAVRRIVILELVSEPAADPLIVRFVMRVDVPPRAQRHFANPSAGSEAPDPTAEELTALRAGTVAEVVGEVTVARGATAALTRTAVRSALETRYQQETAALPASTPWLLFGGAWDGTTWT